jgi:hypothetical protein
MIGEGTKGEKKGRQEQVLRGVVLRLLRKKPGMHDYSKRNKN